MCRRNSWWRRVRPSIATRWRVGACSPRKWHRLRWSCPRSRGRDLRCGLSRRVRAEGLSSCRTSWGAGHSWRVRWSCRESWRRCWSCPRAAAPTCLSPLWGSWTRATWSVRSPHSSLRPTCPRVKWTSRSGAVCCSRHSWAARTPEFHPPPATTSCLRARCATPNSG